MPTHLIDGTVFIDVRAPVEFALGHLPNAINLPILNDQERAHIGTVYKKEGSEAAIRLGHQLVSGEAKKARIDSWIQQIKISKQAIVYCFRGGQRSQITQSWLKEVGYTVPIIEGGFKASRKYLTDLLNDFSEKKSFLLISGPTGSGKTSFLKTVEHFAPTINLEKLANHRGSAFGSYGSAQPTQINFENFLATEFIFINSKKNFLPLPILLEDESRLIGSCIIPPLLFEKMRSSPVIWIDEPLDVRIDNIFKDYILNSDITSGNHNLGYKVFDRYINSVKAISKKLGSARTSEVLASLEKARHSFSQNDSSLNLNKDWIHLLLLYYYDPLYLGSLERRKVVTRFRGNSADCLEYLAHIKNK